MQEALRGAREALEVGAKEACEKGWHACLGMPCCVNICERHGHVCVVKWLIDRSAAVPEERPLEASSSLERPNGRTDRLNSLFPLCRVDRTLGGGLLFCGPAATSAARCFVLTRAIG